MKRIKVWDLAVRATHLLFAVLVLGAFLTADEDANTPLHMRLGLGLLGLALFRVVWGFVGTRHARFSDFVRSPAAVRKALSELVRGRPERSLGHNPVGAVMVLMLLAALLTVTLTGVVVALGPEWSGPLALAKGSAHAVKEVHEVAAWTLVVLIGLHVAGVVTSSILEKQNLLLGMVTGFKDAPATTQVEPPALLPRPAGFVMACLVGGAVVFAVWRLLPVSKVEAATPILAGYEQTARAADPAFTGFSAARGRALYFEEHDTRSGKAAPAAWPVTPSPARAPSVSTKCASLVE